MPDDALTRERAAKTLDRALKEWEALIAGFAGVMTKDEMASALEYRDDLRVLRDALPDPARWCGVVGDVATVEHDTLRLVHRGEIVVTPHQEGA